jgi:hypothetical protein
MLRGRSIACRSALLQIADAVVEWCGDEGPVVDESSLPPQARALCFHLRAVADALRAREQAYASSRLWTHRLLNTRSRLSTRPTCRRRLGGHEPMRRLPPSPTPSESPLLNVEALSLAGFTLSLAGLTATFEEQSPRLDRTGGWCLALRSARLLCRTRARQREPAWWPEFEQDYRNYARQAAKRGERDDPHRA